MKPEELIVGQECEVKLFRVLNQIIYPQAASTAAVSLSSRSRPI